MAKVVALAHAQPAEQFDPLPSIVLALPFPGQYGQVKAAYSVVAVENLQGHLTDLAGDLDTEDRRLARQWGALQGAIEERIAVTQAAIDADPKPSPREQYALLVTQNDELAPLQAELWAVAEARRHNQRAIHLRVIAYAILGFEWPFAGHPPDPTDAQTLDRWPDAVLRWLCKEGLAEVQERLESPLSWNASAAT